VSLKSRLQEVQQVLDLVRSHIREFDFTPEQVFGYHAKADASNLKHEISGQVPVRPAAKKAAAASKTAAVKRKASGGTTASRTGERDSAAKRVAKVAGVAEEPPAATSASTVKTSLNPAAAWPFPTGSRP